MSCVDRREFAQFWAALAATYFLPMVRGSAAAVSERRSSRTVDRWMTTWMDRWRKIPKAPGATLHVSRFKDPIYFLLRPISWKPNADQVGKYQEVEVPTGFVTDFASIPRAFWSLLRPDGEYTYPAIIHDYMYWDQSRPREEADNIFKYGMQDFKVEKWKLRTIFEAVHRAGGWAWDENARLKAQGEKRVLRIFPDDPTIPWHEWKTRPDVFT